jgi:hypothetical protein
MARKSLPAHLRKSGPGTGGRNWDRDLAICTEKKATGATNVALGKKYGLSAEMIRHIINTGDRNARDGRNRWMSVAEHRAEMREERDRANSPS